MHLDEISTKAASGTIDPDSLVWRDGMEEWQPLSSFPELLRLVEERVSQPLPVNRSALSPAGDVAASPSAPRASEPDSHAKAEPQPEPAAALSDPAAFGSAGAEARVPETRASLSETGPAVVADGLDLELAALHRRAGSSKAAWLAVAIALLFGLTIGFVLFSRQETREIVRYVEKPAAQPPAQAERQQERDEPLGDEESSGEAPAEPGSANRVAQRRSGKDQAAPAAGNHTGLSGLKGLKELRGSGPSGGPSAAATPANGGGAQPLDSAKVQATVARYTSSVKRSCWQPALHARDKDAPASARVTVSISVEPSGRVSRVQTSGDPTGYRGLAGCIASRVRSWRFPSSSEPTTANVPFIFAAQ